MNRTWNERFILYSWSLDTDLVALYYMATEAGEQKYAVEVKYY